MKTTDLNRRSFMASSLAGLSGLAWMTKSTATAVTLTRPDRLSPPQFRKRVKGPILSFPTAYTSDFKVDYGAARKMIERALKAGVSVFTLTGGNNQYDRLSYDEIKELTKVMVDTVAGKGITIASTGPWWTGLAVDYARFAESVGADAVQIQLPTYGTDEGKFKHFQEIAKACRLNLVVHGQPSLDLMKRLTEIETVSGFKEEYDITYSVHLYQRFGDRIAIFAGGTKYHFLEFLPYGMQAYYSVFSTLAPRFAMRFWNAIQAGDKTEMKRFVFDYEVPFFDRFSHSFWRASLEHFGVAKRWLRPPEPTFSDQQMAEVREFFDGLGIKPEA
jgi:dihydrodipicolinate synthase/N-acetylneuraminate lyase